MGRPYRQFLLEWEPLEHRTVIELRRDGIDPNAVQIGARLGLGRSAVHQYRRRGTVTVFNGDRLACRLGFHPSLVWGDRWWDLAVEQDDHRRSRRSACSKE